ncbi:hypothetical protein VTO42DRAFT_1946 [Malbranchea cinnamomea]
MSSRPQQTKSPPPSGRARRPSLTELFTRPGNAMPPRPNINSWNSTQAQAQVQVQVPSQPGRRLSLTTLGLGITGTSPTQPSPFGSMRRRDSVSGSVVSTSPTNNGNNHYNNHNENAVLEEDEQETETPVTSPAIPFARRVSFGGSVGGRPGSGISPTTSTSPSTVSSKRRINSSTGTAVPRTSPFQFRWSASTRAVSSSSSSSSSQSASSSSSSSYFNSYSSSNTSANSPAGEGFNWPEALRSRAERPPSFTTPTSPKAQFAQLAPGQRHQHHRSASVATMEMSSPALNDPILAERPPPLPEQSAMQAQQQQQQQKKMTKPDYFQEKILRADFMD